MATSREMEARPADRTWSADQVQFMLWLALPERGRKPRTQMKLAAEMGRNDSTLSEWKHLPGFGAEVLRLTKELVKAGELAQIVYAQVRKAKRGDTAAARFVFETLGELGDAASIGPSTAAAMAVALNVVVNGQAVESVSARHAAARELLAAFTEPHEE